VQSTGTRNQSSHAINRHTQSIVTRNQSAHAVNRHTQSKWSHAINRHTQSKWRSALYSHLSGTAVKYAIIAVNNMLMTSHAFGDRLADG
jgi:hypothetical protein